MEGYGGAVPGPQMTGALHDLIGWITRAREHSVGDARARRRYRGACLLRRGLACSPPRQSIASFTFTTFHIPIPNHSSRIAERNFSFFSFFSFFLQSSRIAERNFSVRSIPHLLVTLHRICRSFASGMSCIIGPAVTWRCCLWSRPTRR